VVMWLVLLAPVGHEFGERRIWPTRLLQTVHGVPWCWLPLRGTLHWTTTLGSVVASIVTVVWLVLRVVLLLLRRRLMLLHVGILDVGWRPIGAWHRLGHSLDTRMLMAAASSAAYIRVAVVLVLLWNLLVSPVLLVLHSWVLPSGLVVTTAIGSPPRWLGLLLILLGFWVAAILRRSLLGGMRLSWVTGTSFLLVLVLGILVSIAGLALVICLGVVMATTTRLLVVWMATTSAVVGTTCWTLCRSATLEMLRI